MLDVLVYQITEIQKHRSDLTIGLLNANHYSPIIMSAQVCMNTHSNVGISHEPTHRPNMVQV